MPAASRTGPDVAIFTDLDGTFLDHTTYSFEAARPAYEDCRAAGVPVVFCSSKTRPEIEELRRRLSASDPFIVENGGAAFIPREHFPFEFAASGEIDHYLVIELGAKYRDLIATLDRLSGSLDVRIQAFHRMTPREIARHTGLSIAEAALAARREYDEAFFCIDAEGGSIESFLRAVEGSGLHWTRGGRFYHLVGHTGKAAAVRALSELYRRWNPRVATLGLGDSANDVSLLGAVDFPVVVKKPEGDYDAEVLRAIPNVGRSPFPGPRGWAASVQAFLRERQPR